MRFLLAVPLLFACSGDPGEPAILDFMAMPAAGAPGDEITVMVTVEDFELVGGGMDMSMDMDMDMSDHDDHDHGHGDAGHIHVYMDDTQSNPLVMMMSDTGTFEVPADATEGMHTLIARLQDADHLILEPEVTFEIDFEVLAASGTGTTGTTSSPTQ